MKFGWITPKKQKFECAMFKHIDLIKATPELKALIPDFEDQVTRIRTIRAGCQSLADREGHGEWHVYEMACDSFDDYIVYSLYKAGCLRVGSNRNDPYIEGKPEAYLQLKPWLDSEFPDHKFEKI